MFNTIDNDARVRIAPPTSWQTFDNLIPHDQRIWREPIDVQCLTIERHAPSSALPCRKLRLSGTFTGTFTGTLRKEFRHRP